MRRNYNLTSPGIIEQLRKRYPLFNFTTDIMVGFPGETEDEFRETCRVVRQAGFSHVHTFRYSIRRSTRAERMDGQVPEKEKQERSNQIREIAAENKLQTAVYRKQQTVPGEDRQEWS
jgi:threonylcarbamoyladenosine tRNA methylthiotransferase MtaB